MTILDRTIDPLLVADKPWESFCLDFVNVEKIRDEWRMWYASYDSHYRSDYQAYLCYARSKDGVRWEKPNLGLISFEGNNKTNIVMNGREIHANATRVFRDGHAPANQRYKALLQRFYGSDSKQHGVWRMWSAYSADGFHWRLADESIYPWNSDTQSVCFWDKNRYRMYMRLWRGVDSSGKALISPSPQAGGERVIGYSESPKFGGFPKGREILGPDSQDPPDMDMYTSACTKLRDDLYVMFISCFYKKEDLIRVQPAFSRDGETFHRLGHKPILDLGNGFDSKSIYVAPGAISGGRPNTYWFYYLGTNVKHDENLPSSVHYAGGIGRFLVRIDDSNTK